MPTLRGTYAEWGMVRPRLAYAIRCKNAAIQQEIAWQFFDCQDRTGLKSIVKDGGSNLIILQGDRLARNPSVAGLPEGAF
jgi:hypothetical protein